MTRLSISPGDDVEAWCTRCKMNLNHRVIAVTNQGIQRVHCLTCHGDHKYYPPKGEKRDRETGPSERAPSSPRARQQTAQRSAVRAESEWHTFMQELPPGAVLRPYLVTELYRSGEFIEHPVFGPGKVIDILGAERMEVIFRSGRKIMICNRPRHAAPEQ